MPIWNFLSLQISSTLCLPSPLPGDDNVSYFTEKSEIKQKLPYLPTTKFNDPHTSIPLSLQSFRYCNSWSIPDKSQKLTRTWLQSAAQISISSPDRPTPLTFYLLSQLRRLTDIPQIQPFPSTSTLCPACPSVSWTHERWWLANLLPFSFPYSSEWFLKNINQLTPLLPAL